MSDFSQASRKVTQLSLANQNHKKHVVDLATEGRKLAINRPGVGGWPLQEKQRHNFIFHFSFVFLMTSHRQNPNKLMVSTLV